MRALVSGAFYSNYRKNMRLSKNWGSLFGGSFNRDCIVGGFTRVPLF